MVRTHDHAIASVSVVALIPFAVWRHWWQVLHKKSHAAKAIPQQLRLDDRGRRDAAALDRQSTQNLKGGPVQTPRVPANEIGVPLKYFLVPTVFSQAPRKFFCKKMQRRCSEIVPLD
jgi:hypothetical protein